MKIAILSVVCVLCVLNSNTGEAMQRNRAGDQVPAPIKEALRVLERAGLPLTLTDEVPTPRNMRYGAFSQYEDEKLKQLVKEHGQKSWTTIAGKMIDRTPRQCRNRWNNYLSEEIKVPWTKEEDDLLLAKYKKLGPKWRTIARFFSDKTELSVKNRWLKLSRKSADQSQARRDPLPEPAQANAIDVIIQQHNTNQNLNQCEGKKKQESNSTNCDSAGDSPFGQDEDFKQDFNTEDFDQTQNCWYWNF